MTKTNQAQQVFAALGGQEQCGLCREWFPWQQLRRYSRWCLACVQDKHRSSKTYKQYKRAYSQGYYRETGKRLNPLF